VPLVLRPLGGSTPSIDCSGLTPDRLADEAPATVARRTVDAGAVRVALGDVLHVSGSAADGRLEFEGDFSRCWGLGAGMAAGWIVVRGGVGRGAGAGMRGGRLEVEGSAGDWLAAAMQGGTVHVRGDAGDDLAAALPGAAEGLTGGTVMVEGAAGCRTGSRMRRGVIAVGGACGAGAGLELRAGTIVVAGALGADPGCGMRRGSIVALGPAPPPGPTFLPGATWRPAMLGLLLRHLAGEGFRAAEGMAAATRRPLWQWHGDVLAGGRGELLLAGGE
jgi:formylmethanofuran dehydrogenase subunit C